MSFILVKYFLLLMIRQCWFGWLWKIWFHKFQAYIHTMPPPDDDGSLAAAAAVGEFDKLICFYCRDMFSFFHELWPWPSYHIAMYIQFSPQNRTNLYVEIQMIYIVKWPKKHTYTYHRSFTGNQNKQTNKKLFSLLKRTLNDKNCRKDINIDKEF